MTIWGNFVTMNNPSISAQIANGDSSQNPNAPNPATSFPPFSIYAPYQLDLNQTGGMPFTAGPISGKNVTEFMNPGLQNRISLVNAYTWEANRGVRCDFWRAVGGIVPE